MNVRVERLTAGRLVKKRCVAASRKNRRAKRCDRATLVANLTAKANAGAGKVTTKRLPKGRYRITTTATDVAGNKSRPVAFTITVKK